MRLFLRNTSRVFFLSVLFFALFSLSSTFFIQNPNNQKEGLVSIAHGFGGGIDNNALEGTSFDQSPNFDQAEVDANTGDGNKRFSLLAPLINGAIEFGLKLFAVLVGVISFLASFVTTWIVGIATAFLNVSVEVSTTGFSEMMRGGIGETIKSAWGVFRDFANIGLVFILLYIAINTIVQAGSFQTKKLLGSTIIVAIAINFSYLAAAVVVDISNILALSIHEQLEQKTKDAGGLGSFIFEKSKHQEASKGAKKAGGINEHSKNDASNFSSDLQSIEGSATWHDTALNWAMGYIMLVILNVVIIVVFLAMSFMLITRVIILMFLLVLSPIGFVSSILPNTSGLSKQWWSALVNNAFFLPIFLLFIYIAVVVVDGGGLSSLDTIIKDDKHYAGGLSATIKGIVGPVVQYSIVIGLFVAGMMISKSMSSGAGGLAGKLSTSINGAMTKGVGGGAMAVGAYASRNTIGRAANAMANSEKWKSRAANNVAFRQVYKGVKGVAGTSFDARNTKTFRGVASATGVGDSFGSGSGEGGYSKSFKDRQKKAEDFGKGLGNPKLTDDQKTEVIKHETEAAEFKKLAKVEASAGNNNTAQALLKQAEDSSKKAAEIQNQRTKEYAESLSAFNKLTKGLLGNANKAAGDAMVKKYTASADKKALNDLKSVLKESNK